MKSSSLPTLLLGVLALSALASLGLCWSHISSVRDVRALQPQAMAAQNNRNIAAQMAAEVIEYSKTHPDILPILDAVGLRAKNAGSPPAQPAKPASK